MSGSDARNRDEDKSKSDVSSNSETRTYVGGSSSGRLGPDNPQQIGKYWLRRVIASGGMGTVFEALQENPRRPVAVKVVKSTLEGENSIRRLEYEAQLLARLRHPGIAQIYEAGTYDEQGAQVPFFAMEYIPNAKSITEFAAEKQLSSRERLGLFLQVCDAVHHGHQRGIVHRDLKPSNILVDSSGRVRIIDFGLARATDADMYQAAASSEYGKLVGSVQYMSPEQFDADPHDIDTRSDVYALGLILYELLSGDLPYNVDSERIHDFAAEVRGGTIVPLGERDKHLRGELEAIVEKALEKNRENRYQSAFGMEQDLRRYLSGDVVIARRPGFRYQLRVFTRRHKGLIALTGSVFTVLLIGVIVTTSLLLKVEEERKRAEIASHKASAGLDFLTGALATAFPPGFGKTATAIDFLDRASQRLSRAFPNELEIEAKLRWSFGKAYMNVGEWKQAERELDSSLVLYRTILEESDDLVLELRSDLAIIYGILDDREAKLENARAFHAAIAKIPDYSEIDRFDAKGSLAYALALKGFHFEARKLAEESWIGLRDILGADSSMTLWAQTRLAWSLMRTGEADEARKNARTALELAERTYGVSSDSYSSARRCLAALYLAAGHVDSAEALYAKYAVPERFGIEKVYQGNFELNDQPFQLVAFFATWCPYSHTAMLKLERFNRRYAQFGVSLVGLVESWGCSSESELEDYLKDNEITFTACRENGSAWSFFEASGTPAIRLLHDGHLVWECGGADYVDCLPEIFEGLIAAGSKDLITSGS